MSNFCFIGKILILTNAKYILNEGLYFTQGTFRVGRDVYTRTRRLLRLVQFISLNNVLLLGIGWDCHEIMKREESRMTSIQILYNWLL